MSEGELLRLSFEGFEALARPQSPPRPGTSCWTSARSCPRACAPTASRPPGGPADGCRADHLPQLHPDPHSGPGEGPGTRCARARSSPASSSLALLIAVPDTGLFVMWKVIIPPLPFLFGPPASGATCARWPPPIRPRERSSNHEALTAPELVERIRLRHCLRRVHPVRRPAPLGFDDTGALIGTAAAGRDGRRVYRRHVLQRQERLVQHDVPAAAGPAHLRPDAVGRRSPTRTASRASAASRTATTSTRAPPTWPTSTTPTSTGPATGPLLRRRVPGPGAELLRGPGRLQARDPGRDGASTWRSRSPCSPTLNAVRQDNSTHTITSLFGATAFAIFYT